MNLLSLFTTSICTSTMMNDRSIIVAVLLFILPIINAEAQNEGIKCHPDCCKRERVLHQEAPNAYTCFMKMKRGNNTKFGTGFLIHPRVVLTAGHNLAYYPTGRVRKVKMFFGSVDSTTYLAAEKIHLKRGKNKFFKGIYCIFGGIRRDFSIIILPDSAVYEKVKGHYRISPIEGKQFESISILGSPGDKDLYEMWQGTTNKYELAQDHIKYDLYTVVRNSGSPIWTKTENDTYDLIGVHSRSYGCCNAAVTINSRVYRQIQKWCSKAGISLQD